MPAIAAASLHRRATSKVLTMRGEIARYRRSTAMVRLANVSRSAITETK